MAGGLFYGSHLFSGYSFHLFGIIQFDAILTGKSETEMLEPAGQVLYGQVKVFGVPRVGELAEGFP